MSNNNIIESRILRLSDEIWAKARHRAEIISLIVIFHRVMEFSNIKIASLAGLAPRANDSGKFSGYRPTCHGRSLVKPLLFLAAMAARNSNSSLKIFYQ